MQFESHKKQRNNKQMKNETRKYVKSKWGENVFGLKRSFQAFEILFKSLL